jgi:hypothetical protein
MSKKSKEIEDFLVYSIKRMNDLIAANEALTDPINLEAMRAKDAYIQTLKYIPNKMAELYDDYWREKPVVRRPILLEMSANK